MIKKKTNINSKSFTVAIVLVIALMFFLTRLVWGWTSPSANPPSGGGALYYYNNNVGISTTTPSYPLTVSTSTDSLFGLVRSGAAYPAIFKLGADSALVINAGASDVLTLKSGNVGIGTTGPGAKLDVGGGGAGNMLRIRGSNYNQVNIAATGNTGWGLLLTQSDATSNSNYHYSTSGNNLSAAIVNVNNDALHFGTNNATRMTINHDGNVGIGTARPSSGLKLDVEGKVGATKYCDQNGNNCKSGFTFYCENRPAQTGKTGDAVCAAWGGACVYMGDLGRGYADEWYNVRCNSGDNTGWGSGFRWRCCKVQ